MKRLLYLIAFLGIANLANSQSISIDNYSGIPGNMIEISIQADGLENVGAMTLYFTYDTSVLIFDTLVAANSQTPDLVANALPMQSTIAMAWSASSAGINFTNASLCTLRFTYLGGDCPLSFTADCEVVDYLVNPILISYFPGSISPAFTVSIDSLEQDYCNTDAAQILYGTPSGGAFQINGQPAEVFSPAVWGTGTHLVTYYYQNVYGVFGSAEWSVSVTALPFLDVLIEPVSCYGNQDGFVYLYSMTGSAPFQINWSTGVVSDSLNDLAAGSYSYTLTTAACSGTGSITIPQPEALITSLNTTPSSSIASQDGQLVCLPAGGTEPYNFSWSTGATSDTLSNLTEGHYSVTVTDSHGCVTDDSIYLRAMADQTIEVSAQWSIISFNVEPIQPNIVAVLSPISANLLIVKNENGLVYWPQYNVNGIGNTIIGEGYQLKMAMADTFQVNGYYLHPEDYPLNLPSGWSMIGYLRTSPLSAITIFNPVVSYTSLVKAGNGSVYWPQYNLNMIGDFLPGQGYQVKMTQSQTLYYFSN